MNDYGPCDNLKNARDYKFGPQSAAMDRTLRCLEKNLLSFTLWNYTSDNTNANGDSWNGEDLSIYSDEQKVGLEEGDELYVYDGLRAARAVVRPYARCVAGTPLVNTFDTKKDAFAFKARSDGRKCDAPTEIFVPKLWCTKESDMTITILEGRFETEEFEHWFFVKFWPSDSGREYAVEIFGPRARASSTAPRRSPSRSLSGLSLPRSFTKRSSRGTVKK